MDDARLFVCARCRRQVLICSRCDRGQCYCGTHCSKAARRTSVQAAGQRYQQTRRGRHAHAERQRRYRARCAQRSSHQEVTHQGSAPTRAVATLAPHVQAASDESMTPSHQPFVQHHCHFCGRAVSLHVRLGWVRTGTRRSFSFPPWS